MEGFPLTESLSRDIMPFVPCYGLLAQLVEHIVHIDGVTGSSPVQTTRNKDHLRGDPFFVSPVAISEPVDPRCETSTGESRRGPPVAEISLAAFSSETSDLSGGQSRRLRMRNTVRVQYRPLVRVQLSPHPQSTHCSLGAVALLVSGDSFASFRLRRQPTGLTFGSLPSGESRPLRMRNTVRVRYRPHKKVRTTFTAALTFCIA